jgi:subtilase family serine protease
MDELLREVYDPSSPSYRHFLTVPEITARFSPTQQDYDAVVAFAQANGMTVAKLTSDRLLIELTAAASAAENAFHVRMGVYQHPTENRTFFSPDREPTVDLNVPLWHIGGLDNYSIPRPLVKRPPAGQAGPQVNGSGPGGAYLPGDMRPAYYYSQALTGANESVGLVEFAGYEISDVTSTFDGAATATTNGSNYILTYTLGGVQYNIQINNVLVDGATSSAPYSGEPEDAEGEVVLDIAQAIGMAPGLQQVRVYIAPPGTEGSGGDYAIFDQMYEDNIAKQVSCSWYWDTYPTPLNNGTDDPIFEAMEAHGQNVFAASGDSGAYVPGEVPMPMADDYVVDVGGTDLTTSYAGGPWSSEGAWLYSGGGISSLSIPTWQEGVANSANGGSTTYRNVPDVAMEANFDNYVCAFGDCEGDWGGTSFAAPRWAGFLALANQVEEANYGTTLGFLNKSIYPIGEGSDYSNAFFDTDNDGTNDCCSQSVYYTAVRGYNLVTGWGSPEGCGLITALAGSCPLPTATVSPTSLGFSSKGDQPVTESTVLTNTGPSGLALVVLSIGTSGAYFSVTGGTCKDGLQMASQSSCSVRVTFAPAGCVNSTGALSISDNSTAGVHNVSLSGHTTACTPTPVQP